MLLRKLTGKNSQDIKALNRGLVLKLISTEGPISRGNIAARTGLTKMTATNIITELLENGVVQEIKDPTPSASPGRIPYLVEIAPTSPVVCGVLLDRVGCRVHLSDYKANILAEKSSLYPETCSAQTLLDLVLDLFTQLQQKCPRNIMGIGISAPGPLSSVTGSILNPPNFYGIRDFPIAPLVQERTGYPCILMHDANAGALAERLYGNGKSLSGFVYLQFHHGIGAGLITDGLLAEGSMGLAGEIGHTSINFDGPECACGNTGCLELYANADHVEKLAASLLQQNPSGILAESGTAPGWEEIVAAANRGDAIAVQALEPFCRYVSLALTNYLNLTDCHTVLLSYVGENRDGMIEQSLEQQINQKLLASEYRHIRVRHACFGSSAPVVGAAAAVTNDIFSGKLPIYEKKGSPE